MTGSERAKRRLLKMRLRSKHVRGKHDLVVASDRLSKAARSLDQKRASELVTFVRRTSAKARLPDVLKVWEESLAPQKRNAPFAVAVASAAPEMLKKVGPSRANRIYDLLGATLASVSRAERKTAADALLNAVLRTPGAVPIEARRLIRRHRSTLQQYPDVWRYIGSFED